MMKLKAKTVYIILILSVCFYAGCFAQPRKDVNTYNVSERICYDKYKSPDINIAERSLLELESIVNSYKDDKIEGLDYNAILGFLYARLYLIYLHKEQSVKANSFLEKSEMFLAAGKNLTSKELEESQKKLIEMIKSIDKRQGVKWQNP